MTFIHPLSSIREAVRIGDNTIIGAFVMIETGAYIGDNVTIQPHSVISRNAVIEDNVFIGPHFSCANNSYIPDGEHGQSDNKRPDFEQVMIIREGTRIGARVTVAPGVIIGSNCFIKMCTIIYKDVPDNTIIHTNTCW